MTLSTVWRRALALGAMVVIAALTLFASRLDTRASIARAEEQMLAQGRALADVVSESSRHGLVAFNQWENEVGQRLLNNARWVAWIDSAAGLDEDQLARMAQELGLFRIMLFDGDGRLAAASNAPAGGGAGERFPENFLEPLLSGERKTIRLGYRTGRLSGSRRFAAGVARAGGGAVVVNVTADNLLITLEEMGPGHLIQTFGAGHGIHYVVVQDETGIQASSTDKVAFLLPAEDPDMRPLAEGAEWVSREFVSSLGPVFEVARVVASGSGAPVLLRVGLDATLLQDLKSDIRRRSLSRAVTFLAALVLASSLLAAWQRQSLLNTEVRRVTDELRLKEAEVARAGRMSAMVSLAAGIAHQIRNPLNTIHMISQLLDRVPDLPGGTSEQIRHIKDESSRIEHIVQQFLDFARPRQPDFETFDLGLVLTDVVAVQEAARGGESGLTFRVDAAATMVELDRQFVIEVMENLLRNAATAIETTGRINVTLSDLEGDALIVVADDGPGIAAEDRDRVFDLYFTTRSEGSGLGLSLAAQMIAAMGGRLTLGEGPGIDGRGSRFEIRLPRKRSV